MDFHVKIYTLDFHKVFVELSLLIKIKKEKRKGGRQERRKRERKGERQAGRERQRLKVKQAKTLKPLHQILPSISIIK